MAKTISLIKEGVKYKDDVFHFNYEHDEKDDLIKLASMKNKIFFNSKDNAKIYYGYSFTSATKDQSVKRDFLHHFKDQRINEFDYNKFISESINRLDSAIHLSKIDVILTPKSSSPLALNIAKIIRKKAPHATIIPDAIVKSAIDKIKIDYDGYLKNAKSEDDKKKRIKQLDSDYKFSTKDGNFQTKKIFKSRAKFFSNFLSLNEKEKEALSKVENSNVLIVDDYKVSGITTEEMIRTVNSLQPSQIYLYVLIKR